VTAGIYQPTYNDPHITYNQADITYNDVRVKGSETEKDTNFPDKLSIRVKKDKLKLNIRKQDGKISNKFR